MICACSIIFKEAAKSASVHKNLRFLGVLTHFLNDRVV